jgi:serine-type D-Ala-D-Ala carboxypeptidase (penicillin-binding protein 5/6)
VPEGSVRGRRLRLVAAVLVALLAGTLIGAVAYQLLRPVPLIVGVPTASRTVLLGAPFTLPWPASGEATLSVPGLGTLGSSGPPRPIPMASTAKVMTALLVLEDHPLTLGQTGPTIAITPADVSAYRRDIALNESSVAVTVGERLSEYQLLQGLLVPSASNFADLLAQWDAGTVDAFVAKMNQRAVALGMTETHYADASGFAPATVSVPVDLVAVAEQAMRDPVFAQIVGQSAISLPIVGTVRSTNALLSEGTVVGIKTGHTDQAGGNLVFAADTPVVGSAPVRIYGAVMGQPSLQAAFDLTRSLVHAAAAHLHFAIVAHAQDLVGRYRAPWGVQTQARPSDDITFLYADGMTLRRRIEVSSLNAPVQTGTVVGRLTLDLGEQSRVVSLVSDGPLLGPGLRWRLLRAID